MDQSKSEEKFTLEPTEDAIKQIKSWACGGNNSDILGKLCITDYQNPAFGQILAKCGINLIDYSAIRYDRENSRYKIYKIKQGKRGKLRTIEEPDEELMEFQRKLIPYFERYPLLDCCMAQKGRGIRDNAAAHANAKFVLRIDISKCYPSINLNHIMQGLSLIKGGAYMPSALLDLAYMAVIFKTDRRVLPTGSPLSPILCNIALTPLDRAVLQVAKKHGYTYTRYIDDLHLSTTDKSRHWDLISEITELIENYGLKVNKKKTKWYTVGPNDKVIITGVRIKEGCTVPREFVRTVRARLQNLAKDKLPIDPETQGCLAYIHSIDPAKRESLLQFYDRRLNYDSNQ